MPSSDKAQPVLDEEAEALKKHRRRMLSMWVFFGIFSLPVFIGTYLVIRSHRAIGSEQAWAEAELAKPQPASAAYGVRGAGLLSKGQVEEALPLLAKAAELEAQAGPAVGVKALVMLSEAQVIRAEKVPAQAPAALAQLKRLEARAAALAPGPQAAAWHAAGKLYAHLNARADAVRCLQKAVDLQPDDWVVTANGERYKHRGIASVYKKDLAGAVLD